MYKKLRVCDVCEKYIEKSNLAFMLVFQRKGTQIDLCSRSCGVKWLQTKAIYKKTSAGKNVSKEYIPNKLKEKKPKKTRIYRQKHLCALCGRKFRGQKWLENHIRENHDLNEYAERLRKTGGIVINADGKPERSDTKRGVIFPTLGKDILSDPY